MAVFLNTKRLILRNFRIGDGDSVYAWRNHPDCARYQRWEDTSRTEVEAYISRHLEDRFLSDQEEQHYIIADLESVPIGEMACFYSESDNCITLGITVSNAHHRKGLAFEILEAVIARMRIEYPSLDIVGLIDPENSASIHLFEKLGFCQECYAESIASYVYTLPGVK